MIRYDVFCDTVNPIISPRNLTTFTVFADIVIIPERNLVYRSYATTIMYKLPLFGHVTDQQNLAKTLRLVRITWEVLWFFFSIGSVSQF